MYNEHNGVSSTRLSKHTVYCEVREKPNKMKQLGVYYQHFFQHVSGIIMPIFRGTRRVLLHVVCCAVTSGDKVRY